MGSRNNWVAKSLPFRGKRGTVSSPEPTAQDHGKDVLYRVAKSDVVGRHMVAARDIHPGEVVFTDQPACIGPDNSSRPMCLGCHRKIDGSYLCPNCRWPLCRPSCARSPLHQAECAVFAAKKAVITVPWFDKPCGYYDAILPIRILLLKMSNPKIYKLVSLLMDHKEALDEAALKYRQRVVDFIRKTCKLGSDFTDAEVHHVLGILSVNSFVVHDTSEDNLDLIGLYPWTSLMSHHCSANTRIVTKEDFSYVCIATTFIPQGAEVTTSYHHYHYHLYGTQYRRKDLRTTWNFDCCCPRCMDPSEFGTLVSAVICELCKLGNLLPVSSTNPDSEWNCDHCRMSTEADEVSLKVKKFEDDIDDVKEDDAAEFEKLLRKMRYFLHENHYWILDVKRKLIDIYGNKPGYELFKLPKETVERKIEFCRHLLDVSAKVCPGSSDIRGYLLFELQAAEQRLVQWKWIRMRITTKQYVNNLKEVAAQLREVIEIFGHVRKDSEEGQMGSKARDELRQVERLVAEMTPVSSSHVVTSSSSTLNLSSSKFLSTKTKTPSWFSGSRTKLLSSLNTSMTSLNLSTDVPLDVSSRLNRFSTHRRSICL